MIRKPGSQRSLQLLRAASAIAVAGIGAGCSGDVARFTDGFYTASTPNQQAIIRQPVNTPYPVQQAAQPAPVDNTPTGSVARAAVQPLDVAARPVERTALAPVATAATSVTRPVETARATAEPIYNAPAAVEEQARSSVRTAVSEPVKRGEDVERAAEPVTTASVPVKTAATAARAGRTEGWTAAGGTHVAVRKGESIYNLSKRYGVPANAIMEANGITDPNAVSEGQLVLIPTYVYSRSAPVSAPDNSARVQAASSSVGARTEPLPNSPEPNAPLPQRAPARQDAALAPQPPQPKPRSGASDIATAAMPRTKPQTRDPAAETAAAPKAQKPASNGVSGGRYVVQQGDTLWGISKKTGASVASLQQANGLEGGNLKIGQALLVPGLTADSPSFATARANVDPMVTGSAPSRTRDAAKASPSIKKINTPSYTPPKAAAYAQTGDVASAGSDVTAEAPKSTGIADLRWPVKGRVISNFGDTSNGSRNDGIDISVPEGTPVKAAENGVVIYAGDGLKELGRTVLVRHDNGLVTVYGNNGDITVKRGQKVKRGEVIAASGMSGAASAPKLHFQVRKDSAPVNPTKLLN